MLGDLYERLGCDRDVRVGRTMITGADARRLKMFGAFAGRDFMPFEFLGFYTGDLLEFEDGKSPHSTTNQYTYSVDDSMWIRPSRRTLKKNQHPISRVNDPPAETKANCTFVVHYIPAYVVAMWRQKRRMRVGRVRASDSDILSSAEAGQDR